MTDALRKKLARIAAKCCDPSTTDALDRVIAGLDRAALVAPAVPPDAQIERAVMAGWLAALECHSHKGMAGWSANRAFYVDRAIKSAMAAAPTAQQEPARAEGE